MRVNSHPRLTRDGFEHKYLVIQKSLRETSGQKFQDNYMFTTDLRVLVRKVRKWTASCSPKHLNSTNQIENCSINSLFFFFFFVAWNPESLWQKKKNSRIFFEWNVFFHQAVNCKATTIDGAVFAENMKVSCYKVCTKKKGIMLQTNKSIVPGL